ncbi:DoxX family protein [Nonomuraea sp. NPDC049421]|uniref:DoxX family protein n=1 Tax=Nonomuraea sp. NPDC049421 TaxID=3155275 RepID=UPI003422B3C0
MTGNEAVSRPASRGRLATRVLLVVRIVVGLDFIIGGVTKLFGIPVMVNLFDRIGAGQWFRYLVGFLELAGGIGVLIPALSGLAAFGLAALLISATFTNVVVIDDPPWVPLFWLVAVAVVARDRWFTTKALFARFGRGQVDVR